MSGCDRTCIDCASFQCKLIPRKCGLECETTPSLCSLCTKERCDDEIRKEYIMKKVGGEDMDIDEDKITELLYRHRHMKDNVQALRREFAAANGLIDTFIKKPIVKRKGAALKARVKAYEEVMTLLGISYEALDSGVDIT